MMKLLLLPCSLLLTLSCGGEPIEAVDPETIPETVTWTGEVQPMLDRYCQGCHTAETVAGGAGEIDFGSYRVAVCEWEELAEVVLEERSMPPGGASRLTARDIAILRSWRDDGFLESEGVAPQIRGDCDQLEDGRDDD